MPLTIRVESYKQQPLGQELMFTLTAESCAIGRGEGNDFILPDPERIVSQRHATIYHQNGLFYLADTSTNGTFVNQNPEPVGHGNSVLLSDGDTVTFGDYLCRVSVEAQQAEPPPAPVEPPPEPQPEPSYETPPPAMEIPPGSDEAFGQSHIDPLALLSGDAAAPVAETATSDPLLTPDTGSNIPENLDLITPPAPPRSPISDHHPTAEHEPFQPPSAVTPLLPDDWDVQPPPRAPTPPPAVAAEQPPAPPTPTPPVQPEPVATAPAATADMDIVQAFLAGAGLPNASVPPESATQFMGQAGHLLRELTRCSKQALEIRKNLKIEFRLEVTTLSHVENNALKQSLDVNDALEKLLFPPQRGFQPPLEAAQEAADDILAHQMAILAGLRAALRAMVERFDPKSLEKGFQNRSVLDNLLPMAKKAKSWELFRDVYAQIASDAENDFMHLFGEEFAIAYEQQVARLKHARRNNNDQPNKIS